MAELKEHLKEAGLPVSGDRADLISSLQATEARTLHVENERICLGFDKLGLLKCKNPTFERSYYCENHQKAPHGHLLSLYYFIPFFILGIYSFLVDIYNLPIPESVLFVIPVFIIGILTFGLVFYDMVTRLYHRRFIDKTNQIVPLKVERREISETKKNIPNDSVLRCSNYSRRFSRSRDTQHDDDANDVGDWGSGLGDGKGPSDEEDDDDDG